MRKLFILTILVFCIGLLFAYSITIVTGQQKKSSNKKIKPTPTPTPKEKYGIQNLRLDKELVFAWCDLGPRMKSHTCPKEGAGVSITAIAKIPGDVAFKYYYSVSSGKIVGEGPNVFWDLSEAKIGTHTIVVGAGNDNIISGDVIIKTIKLEECPECDPGIECPSLSISGPEKTVIGGDIVTVSANLSGEPKTAFQYKWSVSEGTVIAGQGTSTIFVKTPMSVEATFITAKVEIGGVNYGCQEIASTLISVSGGKPEK